MALKTGHYTPASNDVHVQLWPTVLDEDEDSATFGEQIADEDNLPEGFTRETDSAGGAYYVYRESGKVWRHPVTKEAVNVKPGGAIVTLANGHKRTMTSREFREFEAQHVGIDGPADVPVEQENPS